MRMKSFLMIAAVAVATSGFSASVSYDFDTDQSGSFTVVEDGGPDSTINFVFDYSTHTQDAPAINVPIPAAPNSASTTQGVQLTVNNSAGAWNALTLYPDTTGLNLGDGVWQMTFDVWSNHNGDAGGNTGSTETWAFGASSSTANPGTGYDGLSTALVDGFNYLVTVDGGSGSDYRYGAGTAGYTNDNTIPNWNGDGLINSSDVAWSAFFPNDGVANGGNPPNLATIAGCPGKQWVTVRLTVSDAGATRTVEFSRSGDAGAFTTVSTVSGGTGSTANPCIGFGDIFTGSVASEPSDQFVVFDNLVIDDLVQLSVQDWTLYE